MHRSLCGVSEPVTEDESIAQSQNRKFSEATSFEKLFCVCIAIDAAWAVMLIATWVA